MFVGRGFVGRGEENNMPQGIVRMLVKWLEYRHLTLEGERYTIVNPLSFLFRRSGIVRLSNGYEIHYNKKNKEDILNVIAFALRNGIRFGEKENQWKLDPAKGIIETHQGIKFRINSVGLLDETFLMQVHFSGFDLKDKIVVTGGAYKGDTPLFYSYYGAKVYGFEPDPNSFLLALENLKLNPDLSQNIVLKSYAIGKDEEILFPVNDDSGGSSIYEMGNRRTLKIKSISVTTILKVFSISNPYLLDLDIKGSEFTVIEDSSISSFQKIRIEYSPYLLKSPEKNLGYLVSKLRSYGFNRIRIYKHNDRDRFDLLNHGVLEAER